MFTNIFIITATACGLLTRIANAHMVITSPVPYGQSSLTNSPLENDGSDFPCKQRSGVYDITQMNNIPVGVPQKLAFMGGATHGGGSCQLSVTLDKEPTKDSEWRVIYTILGGCPNSDDGNASGSPDYEQNPSFEYTMPKGMPNGQYTLAWTWFNKIGNREMYMNCAPITVSGGADNNDVLETLPIMYVNNIPNEECSTVEGEDFNFPDPGVYVDHYKSTALGSSTTGSGCATMILKGKGAGSAGSAASATGDAGGESSAAAATTAPASSYVATSQMSASAAASSESATDVATITTMATVTAGSAAVSASVPAETGSSNGSSPSTGSCSGGSVSCTSDGSIICIGSDQWGMCNAGCAVPMALAAGTSCSGGTISKRDQSLHLLRHLHRARLS